jgi:hypothetical protein
MVTGSTPAGGDDALARALRAVHAMASVDVPAADLAVLSGVLDAAKSLRSWISSVEVTVTRRTAELHRSGNAGAPEGLLADHGGQSAAEACGEGSCRCV